MSERTMKDVLLGEDNPVNIYLIQKAGAELSNDLRLWLIPHGQDVLTLLRKEGADEPAASPALIVIDLNFSKLNGREVLGELRHLPAYQATPVVSFSAACKDMEEQYSLQLSTNESVQKPTERNHFFAAVHSSVRRWLRQDTARQ